MTAASGSLRTDVRVIGLDLADQLLQLRVQFQAIDVNNQPVRTLGDEVMGGQWQVAFDGHPRIGLRRPHAHGNDGRTMGP